MVGAGGVEGQDSLRLEQHQVDAGQFLEQAGEDHPGGGGVRLERVADAVDEEEVVEALALGIAVGVQDHRQPRLGDRLPEGTEPRLVEVVAVDGSTDL